MQRVSAVLEQLVAIGPLASRPEKSESHRGAIRGLGVIGPAFLCACLVLSGGVAAQADDHSTILTFEAHRATGSLVSYSGRYAVWDDASQGYVSGYDSDDTVAIDQYIPAYTKYYGTPWDDLYEPKLNADGTFSGTMNIYPKATIRASVLTWSPTTLNFSTTLATSSTTLAYYEPMPVSLSLIGAFQAKAGASVTIDGDADPECEVGKSTVGQGFCPLTHRVYLQSKVRGAWKNIGLYKLPLRADNGMLRAITIEHPKGKLYRFYLPASHDYQKSYSRTFKPSPHRSQN